MKRVILCIEDDIYKTACMKNCAEAGFHLEVRITETSSEVDLLEKVIAADADEILYLPHEGIDAFMVRLRKSGATRLNTEIRILLCQQFESTVSKVVRDTVTEVAGMSKSARTRLRRSHARARRTDEDHASHDVMSGAAGNAGVAEGRHLLKKREGILKQAHGHSRASSFAQAQVQVYQR
jgi:hypothetical protein